MSDDDHQTNPAQPNRHDIEWQLEERQQRQLHILQQHLMQYHQRVTQQYEQCVLEHQEREREGREQRESQELLREEPRLELRLERRVRRQQRHLQNQQEQPQQEQQGDGKREEDQGNLLEQPSPTSTIKILPTINEQSARLRRTNEHFESPAIQPLPNQTLQLAASRQTPHQQPPSRQQCDDHALSLPLQEAVILNTSFCDTPKSSHPGSGVFSVRRRLFKNKSCQTVQSHMRMQAETFSPQFAAQNGFAMAEEFVREKSLSERIFEMYKIIFVVALAIWVAVLIKVLLR